jgi:hypothetical protein
MSITHQTIRCLFLGAVAAALASCASEPETVYVHHHTHYREDDRSTLPGATTHLSEPGAPETFRAQGPAQ